MSDPTVRQFNENMLVVEQDREENLEPEFDD